MATLYQTDEAQGIKPMPIPDGQEDVTVRIPFSLTAAFVVNDIIEFGSLPANMLVADWYLDTDDLDSGGSPAITLDVGMLNAAKDDIDTTISGGAAWLASSTVAQAGGLVRAVASSFTRMTVDAANDRPFGVKVSTAPATGATTGTLALTVTLRPSRYGY